MSKVKKFKPITFWVARDSHPHIFLYRKKPKLCPDGLGFESGWLDILPNKFKLKHYEMKKVKLVEVK